ncbi:MAG: 50S ribosomal protein L15 [Candidatus Absconditabacterales bacterium]|nr:50S ribosomal protein L15 [Candidatus Absconditabacterales bacterium]
MKLHEIKRSSGLKDKANRIGRGNASKGNYSGKGHKGQKARSGGSIPVFFEGGQTPIVQQMPKARGFKRYFKLLQKYSVINLGRLQKDERITDKLELNKFKLKELGYIKKESDLVKVLGNGDFSKEIVFVGLDKFSKSAMEKIEKTNSKIN